ncbi:MAG: type II toxin-antitoxin system RelE/ParE family toxin [Alphaproteobacteria bacterium]|nr:type II toxin-antitoxin system RelE/ParE family toxin [Alphaproteobacteria bacterium]
MYKIEFSDTVVKQLKKLEKLSRQQILKYIKETISPLDSPRMLGKPLRGNLSGLWRYRIGNYRIICRIYDEKLLVCVFKVEHRRDIYER